MLGGDGGSAMQPHVPDRLDPWGPGLCRAHSPVSAVDSISAQFLAQEQNDYQNGESIYRCGGPGAADALLPSPLVWVQMYKPLKSVNLYV